jgi:hypothetical protein
MGKPGQSNHFFKLKKKEVFNGQGFPWEVKWLKGAPWWQKGVVPF